MAGACPGIGSMHALGLAPMFICIFDIMAGSGACPGIIVSMQALALGLAPACSVQFGVHNSVFVL